MVFIKFAIKSALKQDQTLHMGETSHYSLLQGGVTYDTFTEFATQNMVNDLVNLILYFFNFHAHFNSRFRLFTDGTDIIRLGLVATLS